MPHLGERMIVRVFAKHDPYWATGHLAKVKDEMATLGDPCIKVVEWRGDYFAVEGSHRLCAAHELGLAPKLEIEFPDRSDSSDERFWDRVRVTLPHYSWLI